MLGHQLHEPQQFEHLQPGGTWLSRYRSWPCVPELLQGAINCESSSGEFAWFLKHQQLPSLKLWTIGVHELSFLGGKRPSFSGHILPETNGSLAPDNWWDWKTMTFLFGSHHLEVSKTRGTPNLHPKMIILVGKPHGFVGETHHFRKPPSFQLPVCC